MIVPRIASLPASATETLYALGLGDHVVAVSHECDFPEEVRRIPRVTKAHIDAKQSSGRINEQFTGLARYWSNRVIA